MAYCLRWRLCSGIPASFEWPRIAAEGYVSDVAAVDSTEVGRRAGPTKSIGRFHKTGTDGVPTVARRHGARAEGVMPEVPATDPASVVMPGVLSLCFPARKRRPTSDRDRSDCLPARMTPSGWWRQIHTTHLATVSPRRIRESPRPLLQ